jgi:MFS family permease
VGVAESLFGSDAEILRERDFQALLLANVTAPLGAGIVSPILDSLIGPFETTAADVGLMISFFTAPAIVMILVAGLLADRVGRKPVLVGSLVLFGAAGTAIAFAPDFRTALALRLLQGVGFGGITPVIIAAIGDLYQGTRDATAQGIRFMGSGLSSMVFPLVSGALVIAAWQQPFLLYAMSFPIAAVVYVWFEEPTDDDPGPSETTSPRDHLTALFALSRQPRVAAIVVARSLPMFVWIGFITYNSIVVVRVLGGTPTQAGVVFALASFVYAAAGSQAGRVRDAFDSLRTPLVVANCCLGAGFVVFVFAPSLVVAGAGTTLLGAGFGLSMSLYRSLITGYATETVRGGLVSVAESLGRVAATLAPLCMGALIAVTEPQFGLAAATRVAGVSVAAVGAGGGVTCVLLARAAAPVEE